MLTQERLKELLHYDETTGLFTWLVARQGVRSCAVAGHLSQNGYIVIRIDGRIHKAHRLAWLYFYGNFPPAEIDHIDRRRANNSITNLRPATSSENKMNAHMQSNNSSGFKGVSWDKRDRKWRAYAGLNGKQKSLGYFATAEAAAESYQAFARQHHGEFYLHPEVIE